MNLPNNVANIVTHWFSILFNCTTVSVGNCVLGNLNLKVYVKLYSCLSNSPLLISSPFSTYLWTKANSEEQWKPVKGKGNGASPPTLCLSSTDHFLWSLITFLHETTEQVIHLYLRLWKCFIVLELQVLHLEQLGRPIDHFKLSETFFKIVNNNDNNDF